MFSTKQVHGDVGDLSSFGVGNLCSFNVFIQGAHLQLI